MHIQFPKMNVRRLLSYEAKLLLSEGRGRMYTDSHTVELHSTNTTLQGFQKRYLTLLYLKGLKRNQQKYK